MTTAATSSLISDELKQQYQTEGYMVLERAIPEDMLVALREECSYFIGYLDAELDAKGQPEGGGGITHRGNRYFIGNRYHLSHRMWRHIYSDLMAEITQAALGPNVYLFNEQWVVKGADKGMHFGWHQDSGYVKHGDKNTRHPPYLSCWCALDDMSVENGTVYVLPHSRGGTSHTIFDHNREDGTNDLIGYTGDDPGIPIICPAGTVVCFSSYNFHRSSANTTPRMRRVHLAQYSSEPLLAPNGKNWALAVPFVKDGKVVYDHASDTRENAFANRRTT